MEINYDYNFSKNTDNFTYFCSALDIIRKRKSEDILFVSLNEISIVCLVINKDEKHPKTKTAFSFLKTSISDEYYKVNFKEKKIDSIIKSLASLIVDKLK